MDIEIFTADNLTRTDALDRHIHDKLNGVGRRFGDRLTRVRVHLRDVNAGKGGVDKVCKMEARPAGDDPVAVEAQDEEMYRTVRAAAGKLERALEHRFARKAGHH